MSKNATQREKQFDREATCPYCREPITGIATSGPSTHHLAPCGHTVSTVTARDLGGGRDV